MQRPRARFSAIFQSHQHAGEIKNPLRKIHISFWLGLFSIGFSVFVYFVFVPLLWPFSIISLFFGIMGLASANSCIRNHLQDPASTNEDLYMNARISRMINTIAFFLPFLLIIGMMIFLFRVFSQQG